MTQGKNHRLSQDTVAQIIIQHNEWPLYHSGSNSGNQSDSNHKTNWTLLQRMDFKYRTPSLTQHRSRVERICGNPNTHKQVETTPSNQGLSPRHLKKQQQRITFRFVTGRIQTKILKIKIQYTGPPNIRWNGTPENQKPKDQKEPKYIKQKGRDQHQLWLTPKTTQPEGR